MPNIPSDFCNATSLRRGDIDYLSFGGCNYLGLAHHPKVLAAAQRAVDQYGLSSSASRETTGNARPHAQLESQLTTFANQESGLLVPDGYTANLAALQGLEQLGVQHAVIDSRAHPSLKDAAILAQMQIHTFNHLDADHAQSILQGLSEPAVVLTDSVFTTDGDLAPSESLLDILKETDWLILDDCHGFAVLGEQGRGISNYLNLESKQLIITTTLAKGLGCAGGIVMGNSIPVEAARNYSIAYRCTTPASPALVSAGLEALNLLRTDSQLNSNLNRNIVLIRQALRSLDIDAHDLPTCIFAFTIGDETNMKRLEKNLLDQRIILPLMEYPNGPAPIYFRLSINASHTPDQIHYLKESLSNAMNTQPRGALA
ncbi:MAG: aminotransferase class I/II-fold pyridoxal phosphate-dependent enzyme [Phycisphaerales bacterium]|nr:aminotransferase class I/II-fold pyridoxal phosphate-dependent enzyme [Phycisphaerales bacterium]